MFYVNLLKKSIINEIYVYIELFYDAVRCYEKSTGIRIFSRKRNLRRAKNASPYIEI
jgi:hypothetical protein